MKEKEVKINHTVVSNKNPIVIIAGPCVLTTQEEALEIASHCKKISEKHRMKYIFKGSYDKANRTNIKSFRGPGIDNAVNILANIKKELDVPVLTDVHSVSDIDKVAKVVDIIQIPAFLSRQTDLIVESAKTQKIINVKKGQFLAPFDMQSVAEKIESTGNKKIIFTERGTSFGYNNLVVDMRGIEKMKSLGHPVIFDATHSVQLPGGKGICSDGEREYVLPLAKSAVALGIAGVFLETHPNPEKSLSDSATIVPISSFDNILATLKKIDKVVKQ